MARNDPLLTAEETRRTRFNAEIWSDPYIDSCQYTDIIESMTGRKFKRSELSDSEAPKSVWEAVINDTLRQQFELVDKFASDLRKLDEVERHARKMLGMGLSADLQRSRALLSLLDLYKSKDYDAARWALNQIGKPAGPTEIVDRLLDNGYGIERKKEVFLTAVINGMKRFPKIFRKTKDGWSLVEWDKKK